MKQSKDGSITTLKPQKWLRSVEEVGLLHLLWIPHYHRAPITIFVIRQLLYLMHDGYLWLEESIPITTELIHRISRLPYIGRDPAKVARKSGDLALAETMKKKYKLEKKQRGYVITSIQEKGVRVATQRLARKVMRKCHDNKVPAMVIVLAEQCAQGVQFNWAQFLCEEFLTNYEAQEQGKAFHYTWLLLSILLVEGEFPEDSQFPPLDQDLLVVVKYASLWAARDALRIRETKIFWILMEASIQMWTKKRSRLSPTVYDNLWSFSDFKVDMHNVYIRAQKDLE